LTEQIVYREIYIEVAMGRSDCFSLARRLILTIIDTKKDKILFYIKQWQKSELKNLLGHKKEYN